MSKARLYLPRVEDIGYLSTSTLVLPLTACVPPRASTTAVARPLCKRQMIHICIHVPALPRCMRFEQAKRTDPVTLPLPGAQQQNQQQWRSTKQVTTYYSTTLFTDTAAAAAALL